MIITPAQGAVDTGYSGSQQIIVQNLGPGTLYLGSSNQNLLTTGLYLPSGATYEFTSTLNEGANAVWLLADGGNCDVRILNVG